MSDEKQKLEKALETLKPCPFCGERLVIRDDHHGSWIAHKNEPAPCEAGVTQLFEQRDFDRWNTRKRLVTLDAPETDADVEAVREALKDAWDFIDCDRHHKNPEIAAYAKRVCGQIRKADLALARLFKARQTAPDGYVLAPVEPTGEMLSDGGYQLGLDAPYVCQQAGRVYRAMIAAAPKVEG